MTDIHPAAKPHQVAQQIEFLDNHVPTLRAGNYRMMVTQTLTTTDPKAPPLNITDAALTITPTSAKKLKDVPTSGKNTIFVSTFKAGHHFRLFATGTDMLAEYLVLDTAEQNWPDLLTQIDALPVDQGHKDKKLSRAVLRNLGVKLTADRSFTVAGERYTLNPQDILSVFPPPDSMGDHSNVLPHVILGRSTLPWERISCIEAADAAKPVPPPSEIPLQRDNANPWLAVLLFNDTPEDMAPKAHTIKLGKPPFSSEAPSMGTLYNDTTVSFVSPDWRETEGGEAEDQPLRVIDLPWGQLKPLLPKPCDLPFLAHVRKRVAAGTEKGADHAVVIGNRLPKRGINSVAYLVSLENRFIDGAFWPDVDCSRAKNKAAAALDPETKIRLVVLKTWRFGCLDETSFMPTQAILDKHAKQISPAIKRFFKGAGKTLLGQETVGKDAFAGKLSELKAQKDIDLLLHISIYKKLGFKSLLMGLDKGTMRLPDPKVALAKTHPARSFLKQGNIALPHRLRGGDETASWYHGPLANTATDIPELPDHALTADHLLRYNPKIGMLDTSYAAAWELGRLMMLSSKSVALALFNWKRAHARRLKAGLRAPHLPFSRPPAGLDVPVILQNWVYDTALLRGLPFNYLVPDPNMLPRESIRFFRVNKTWIKCLLDGAFSIGRLNDNDMARESATHAELGLPLDMARCPDTDLTWPNEGASGVLIRSDVIAGWPHLQVDGITYLDRAKFAIAKIDLHRMKKCLSVNGRVSQQCYNCLAGLPIAIPPRASCRSFVIKYDDAKKPIGWVLLDDKDRVICNVDAYKFDPNRLQVTLPHLRCDRLSRNTLIAVFHGQIEAIRVHQKPEALHFGISEPTPPKFATRYKMLRDADTGAQTPDKVLRDIPWRDNKINRVLDIACLAGRISNLLTRTEPVDTEASITSGQFALQMIEGVEQVRFEIESKS